jgi:hypothetical protein
MGGLCSYSSDPANEEETNMFGEEGKILVHKHQVKYH